MAGSQQEHSDVALHGTWPSHTFLALATQIHQTGFTITIATTPINIDYLRSTIVANHQSHDQICLVALPFNSSDHDLPPNTEAVPLNQLITLFQASTALEAPCYKLLADITAKEGVENSIVREEVKRVIDLVDKNGKKGQEMKKKAVEIGELIKAAVRKEEGRRGLLFKQWMILFLPFSQLLRLEGNHFVLGGHGLS
ncbi:UDP-glycosyltransferase 92A1 [Camellia lanceoleosa]|uniref:UDP-glycosyltransferase 92A1 n=1 Tax=Camellia lanceoleosa TaxID=1840588 RepID=A0ACC0G6G5_9ERIC|nr:UDP-glycosyltransferase 92A1 [Camellia lanceoleosa]